MPEKIITRDGRVLWRIYLFEFADALEIDDPKGTWKRGLSKYFKKRTDFQEGRGSKGRAYVILPDYYVKAMLKAYEEKKEKGEIIKEIIEDIPTVKPTFELIEKLGIDKFYIVFKKVLDKHTEQELEKMTGEEWDAEFAAAWEKEYGEPYEKKNE